MNAYGNDLNAANQRRAAALRGGGATGGGGNVSSSSPFNTGRPAPAAYVRPQANIMDTIKQGMQLYDKGSSMYDALTASNSADSAGTALGGASGTGAGGSLTMDLGAGSGASTAADTGSAASSGSSATGALGNGLAWLGAAKTALDFTNGLGHKQGVEGRDQGNLGGQLGSAVSGAASGFTLGGPIGAIVGAAGGNEAYQMKHGNREGDLKPVIGGGEDFDFMKSLEYYLKGGPAGADIKGWLGL